MRDLSKPFRLAIFNALTGNTGGIPMFDEKRFVASTANTFILFSTQQQTPVEDNDCTWISKLTIDIEIYNKTGSEVTKDTIDDISNTILTVLLPSVGVTNITSGNIQFSWAQCDSIISRNVSLSETESVMVKVIRFSVVAVEQSN